jgi:hypothetical protein
LAFLTQNKAQLCKILIITLVFEKNANFLLRKLSKIVIITSTQIGRIFDYRMIDYFGPYLFSFTPNCLEEWRGDHRTSPPGDNWESSQNLPVGKRT